MLLPSEVSPGASTAAIFSPSISTSAWMVPWADTTLPFLMRMVMRESLRG